MCWVFCFRFYLLFVSTLWIYGVSLGPNLFVDLLPKKASMRLLI